MSNFNNAQIISGIVVGGSIIYGIGNYFGQLEQERESIQQEKNEIEKQAELVLTVTPMRLDVEELDMDFSMKDKIKVEITGGNFVLQDNCIIKSVKFTDDQFLYRDKTIDLEPKIGLKNCFIANKILNENQTESWIELTLDLDLVPNGSKIGSIEDGEIFNIAEITYEIFYREQGIVKSEFVKNIVELSRTKPTN